MGEEKPQTLISLIWGLLNVSFLPEAEDLYLRFSIGNPLATTNNN
jgi:hypothetical protein